MGKQGSPRSPRPETRDKEEKTGRRSLDSLTGNDLLTGRRIFGSEASKAQGSKHDQSCGSINKFNYSWKQQHSWLRRNFKSILVMISVTGLIFFMDSIMVTIFHSDRSSVVQSISRLTNLTDHKNGAQDATPVQMYSRLLNLASSSLAKNIFKPDTPNFLEERSSKWKPCADNNKNAVALERSIETNNGYIMVSANGGLNQQRVAICNAVAVAALLNVTLVLPRFLYSNVWKDPSQFGDIYQDERFIEYLKDDVHIVKDLPQHLKAIDNKNLSLVTDTELIKEAKPDDYIKNVLPLLKKYGMVHLFGYGNRLGFDPLPFDVQRLRCKCNFHALKFAPKIQKAGSLLVKRIRRYETSRSKLDEALLGESMAKYSAKEDQEPLKYLALHLRFEEDMVAYSLCDFGGGETERKELQAYREEHFPLLLQRLKESKSVSPEVLRKTGRCPLTPEEATLVLAGLGFNRGTYIYLAGSQIYGGSSRMLPLTTLYPNLVTKETLLTPQELAPFKNFSSQLAALDFIACAASDVFAMTDSGSQLSSLVSGFRTYYGNGHAPTLRPNKKRLAAILSESETINWKTFESRVRKMIEEGHKVRLRPYGRSIYRQPKCPECMCKF
ncbi:O-fucosyltransferase family protein [Raphanus sativus]|uniref:O-fucosyltransferase family protein n=1 Tax=Raphanus sativus TaxID=3726 RepID=A0A6J0K3J6_RAPSA|nr:O-fucosyltransferase 8 [Raphanus sativus]XP_056867387.1 O-fucosyltransferase 8 [Raphanus sativus]KAJ4916807.1 O-fucosyltransferase family protein [Raphanus sativus]